MTQLAAANQNLAQSISRAQTDAQVINLWVRGKSETTREYYRDDAERFLSFCGASIREATLEDLYDYMDTLNEAPQTNYRRMSVVKSLLTFAHDIGYTRFNVGKALELKRPHETLGERIVEKETIHRLIDAADSERDRLVLRTLYYVGMRASELVSLRWRDLNSGVLTVRGKGGKTRHVKLRGPLAASLIAYRDGEGPDERIFAFTRQTAWNIVKRAKKNAGVEKEVSPHWFRHAHVSHALDNGAPIHLVQEGVGHSSLQTTSKYTHTRPDESSGDYL